MRVLDLYAGTGSISFEFISRGCEDVTSVEQNRGAVQYLRRLKQEFQPSPQIIESEALRYLDRVEEPFDLIFADPPYQSEDYEKIIQKVKEKKLLRNFGPLILEHQSHSKISLEEASEQRVYGQSTFSFYTFDQ
jgi:16S rRNA (guanine(966)-N(2))-methyltransferase RsmD